MITAETEHCGWSKVGEMSEKGVSKRAHAIFEPLCREADPGKIRAREKSKVPGTSLVALHPGSGREKRSAFSLLVTAKSGQAW